MPPALALVADSRESTSRDSRRIDEDDLTSVLAEVPGSTFARVNRGLTDELGVMNRMLALLDLTVEEVAGIVHPRRKAKMMVPPSRGRYASSPSSGSSSTGRA